MPRLKRAIHQTKTTSKKPLISIGILYGQNMVESNDSRGQILGKEIARCGHTLCSVGDTVWNRSANLSAMSGGSATVSYLSQSVEDRSTQADLKQSSTHTIITNLDYENTVAMMLRSISVLILIPDTKDEIKIYASQMPRHLIVGILTNEMDLSRQIADIVITSGLQTERIFLDSSISSLIKRIDKRIRLEQLNLR